MRPSAESHPRSSFPRVTIDLTKRSESNVGAIDKTGLALINRARVTSPQIPQVFQVFSRLVNVFTKSLFTENPSPGVCGTRIVPALDTTTSGSMISSAQYL